MAFEKINYEKFDVLGHEQVNAIQDELIRLDQLNAISADAYLWKVYEPEKHTYSISTSTTQKTYSSGTVKYSSDVVIDGDTVTLVNPTSLSLSSSADFSVLSGKFYTVSSSAVMYIHPNDKLPSYAMTSGYTFYYRTVTPYMINRVLLSTVVSSDINAYPHNGEKDNLYYEFCGHLVDYIGNSTSIQTGSYTGTGTYGKNNPNILTFSFVPKFFMVYVVGNTYNTSNGTQTLSITSLQWAEPATNAMLESIVPGSGVAVSVLGNTISWYSGSADEQLNFKNDYTTKTYNYIAMG